MKKEGKIGKFNLKKRTVMNIMGKGTVDVNGRPLTSTTNTFPPTISGLL